MLQALVAGQEDCGPIAEPVPVRDPLQACLLAGGQVKLVKAASCAHRGHPRLRQTPLDGGRVLRAALWHHRADREKAERGAASAGRVIGAVLAALGVAEILLTRNLVSGLWLILLGWFMTIADVMTPDPDVAAAWLTAAEFSRQLRGRSAQPAFPVIGPGGALTGIVTVSLVPDIQGPLHAPPTSAGLRSPPQNAQASRTGAR